MRVFKVSFIPLENTPLDSKSCGTINIQHGKHLTGTARGLSQILRTSVCAGRRGLIPRVSFLTGFILYVVIFFHPYLYSQEPQHGGGQDQPGAQDAQQGAQQQGVQQGQDGGQIIESLPLLEIKRLEAKEPYTYSIELRDVELSDFFRVVAHDYDMNILVDREVSGTVTASLTSVSLEEALETITEMNNLVLETKGKIFIVKPHFITKTFFLQHVEASTLLGGGTSSEDAAGGDAAGGDVAGGDAAGGDAAGGDAAGGDAAGGDAAGGDAAGSETTAGAATIYDLLSDRGKILLGSKTNSLTVIDYPKNVEMVESYLQTIDRSIVGKVFKLKYISAREAAGVAAESEEDSGEDSEEEDAGGEDDAGSDSDMGSE